jgi:hypothetical protein
MSIPVIQGLIDRRILVNYRVDPRVLAEILPAPFRPQLVAGYGLAGICLIRLRRIRPQMAPWLPGISSENAAHRIAVEWTQDGQLRQGVYIPRRDTSSRLNALAGGRLFPGLHHHARFEVAESEKRLSVAFRSDDGSAHAAVAGRVSDAWPSTSAFDSLAEASAFFEAGSLGYSATGERGQFDGLELRTFGWHVEPLQIEQLESSYFGDHRLFPRGSLEFDCALLMRGIEHQWHARGRLNQSRSGSVPSAISLSHSSISGQSMAQVPKSGMCR